ncbi:MAG TPA: 2-oxoglutarate dehydrogenase, E2 component, dihydrolipoamide succinyltransferase, partial [Deltaproteobacteria bacterium]|nr:2-oxoglutarate dehydrogenase, E2 component, dihydrolipoamide succinyltransferase [Deltaproteobacteria bacterium]
SNGNLASQPLINQPQVAILAMGVVRKRVVVVTDDKGKDAMGIRPMMFLTLCYDHRANDGAASGRFLRDLRKGLELWQDQH